MIRAYAPAGPRPAEPPGQTWEGLMSLGLLRARAAAAIGEVPVGAAICDAGGRILAACANATASLCDPTAHAEILAIRAAARAMGNFRLNGCVLAVTLEPCAMCAGAIREARLAGVVFGAADALAGAVCSRAEFFALAPAEYSTWHMGGVLAEECSALLAAFFSGLRAPRAASRGM